MGGGVPFGEAHEIRVGERDLELELEAKRWPSAGIAPNGWEEKSDHLRRVINMEWPRKELQLEERLLRFPSAPIHGLHRLSQDHVNMGPVEAFHSYRVLSKPRKRAKVSRIFLMHNGLNETDKAGFYYRLASYLIEQDPNTTCILRPFPGHLTRCAYAALSETPLDHYLWDGLHLFRQFLRYMMETRWLLSTLARYSYYHCVSGSGLLGQSPRIENSRLETKPLAQDMATEWERLYAASAAAIDKQGDGSPKLPDIPKLHSFKQAIDSLRSALRLDQYPGRTGAGSMPFNRRAEPELHVVGYSLGGFTAQSVFMSWAFMVSSCSTLLSGGAMRELAPTAFADPEEWQTVLHSLRYELDDALMDWRFAKAKDGSVAGLEPRLFRYLKRTFYEVFEQEYRGSFQTRLAAFRRRMLFVVGGNDPIVRPQSVLDSGPPDGINMIAVGGLGHFLDGVARGRPEEEQHSFWLPEVGRTIGSLAADAAAKHREDLARTWLDEDDLIRDRKSRQRKTERWRDLDRLSIAERLEVERGGKLSSALFHHSLDDLLARAIGDKESRGLLFILKNEPPTFLLDKRALQQRGSAMYHEDVSIVEYVRGVQRRWNVIHAEGRDRLCLVMPHNVRTILRRIDAGLQHPSQSESSGEPVWLPEVPDDTWSDLYDLCTEQTGAPHQDWIRIFDGGHEKKRRQLPEENSSLDPEALSDLARSQFNLREGVPVIPALPDCWVWVSNEFFGLERQNPPPTLKRGISWLGEVVPGCIGRENEAKVSELLRRDALRMITISRARYNPRFRGRIVGEPRLAQLLLLRVALCLITSVQFREFEFPDLPDIDPA